MNDTRMMLTKKQVTEIVGLSFTKVWGLVREGKFPAPVDIGGIPRWFADEVSDWQNALPRKAYKPVHNAEAKPPMRRVRLVAEGRFDAMLTLRWRNTHTRKCRTTHAGTIGKHCQYWPPATLAYGNAGNAGWQPRPYTCAWCVTGGSGHIGMRGRRNDIGRAM